MVGCNFIPSTAINQLEMWQPDTFDPETIDRELGWAADLGFNTVRVYLHDLLWQGVADTFKANIDRYLDIANRRRIKTMFVLLTTAGTTALHWANNLNQSQVPIFRDESVGCYNWGLVSGKTQTIYTWQTVSETVEPPVWFHDIFRPDGTPYRQEEVATIRRLTGRSTSTETA